MQRLLFKTTAGSQLANTASLEFRLDCYYCCWYQEILNKFQNPHTAKIGFGIQSLAVADDRLWIRHGFLQEICAVARDRGFVEYSWRERLVSRLIHQQRNCDRQTADCEHNIDAKPPLQPINIRLCSQLAAVTDDRISYRFRMFCFHASVLKAILKECTFQRGGQLLPPLFGRNEIGA